MADPSERLGFCALLGFPYGGASRTAEMSARRSFPCGGTSCTAEAPARGKFRAAGALARANRSSRTAELPSLRTFPCGGAFRTAKFSARQSLPHARVFCTAELPARLCFPYGGTFRTAWLPTRRSFRTADFPVRWGSPPKNGKRVQNLSHKSVVYIRERVYKHVYFKHKKYTPVRAQAHPHLTPTHAAAPSPRLSCQGSPSTQSSTPSQTRTSA